MAGSFDGVLTVSTLDPGYDYDAGDLRMLAGLIVDELRKKGVL